MRKKTKGSSTSATITKQPFAKFNPSNQCKELYEHTRLLPIPGMTDDYNHYMGGVDIADQLRAKFSTQQRGVKPWRALFYWLLDTATINAFCIFEHQRKARLGLKKDKARSTHRAFQESLVIGLLGLDLPKPIAQPEDQLARVTKTTLLPHIRLTRPIEIHQLIPASKRTPCYFCRWSRHSKAKNGITTRVIAKSRDVNKTKLVCSHCSIALCANCFKVFHYFKN
jgi:hypothetical protein